MRRSRSGILVWSLSLLIAAAATAGVQAQQAFDPAARIAAVAPFVTAKTLLVAHADLTRIDLGAADQAAGAGLPGVPAQMLEQQRATAKKTQETLKKLLDAGATDAYFVLYMGNPAEEPKPSGLAVFVLREGADPAPAVAALTFEGGVAPKVVEGRVVLGDEQLEQLLAGLQPRPRPEFAAGFEAAGNTALQCVIVPNAAIREFPLDLPPTIPPQMSAAVVALQKNTQWIALTANTPPKTAFALLLQMSDDDSAGKVRDAVAAALALAKQNPIVVQVVPKFDDLAALLTPKVQDGRLKIVLTQANGGIQKVTETIQTAVRMLLPALGGLGGPGAPGGAGGGNF